MTVRTLPIWVYLLTVGVMIILILPQINYYLSTMGKLRVECLKDKPEEQRSNSVVRLERRINEGYYSLIVFGIYVVTSVGFLIDNHGILPENRFLILEILIGFAMWSIGALITVVIGTGLMNSMQNRAVKDLKRYYERRFHVTVMYLDKIDLEEYYDYKTLEY